jgi:hypothetical protein
MYIITLNFTQSYLKDECDMGYCSDCGYVLLDGVKLSDKSVIDSLIKQIIESLEDKATIICGNESEQEQLINSLQILETQKGFFRRFKPNWMQAKLLVERILKTDHFPDDDNELRNSRAMSEKGLILWHLVTKYSNYMNSDAIDELTRLFISGEFDLLSKKFLDMKASLVDLRYQSTRLEKNGIN